MNALKIGLLILVAVLLLIFLIDRMREAAPLLAIKQTLDRLNDSSQQQVQELQAMRRELAARPAMAATQAAGPSTTTANPETPDPVRDGNPKLGVNFLMPYDGSYFRPEWLGGTLHKYDASPKSLNPLTDNSATSHDVYDMVTDSLCDRTPMHPELWSQSLAESVIISDDYKVYTFIIRHGIKWQRSPLAKQQKYAWLDKDVELTADDFKFTLDMILNPQVDCPSERNYYEDLDHAEVLDPYTLRLVWKKKVYTSLTASMGLAPLPRHIYAFNADGTPTPPAQIPVAFNQNQHWFDREHQAMGVGAYILEEFQPDKIMRFRRNPDYWGATWNFANVEWILDLKQDDARLVAFKNGQLDVMALPPLLYKSEIVDHNEPRFAALDPANPKAGRTGELGWERFTALGYYYLGWNLRHPPFDDIKVRQAMSFAFPKKRITDQVFYGLGEPVLSEVPRQSQYCNKDLLPFDFNLEKSRALLAEAGWADSDGSGVLSKTIDGQKKTFSFTIKYYANSPEWDNALLIYKNELKKLGIELNALPLEWKELVRVYEDHDFEAIVGSWQTVFDIDFFQIWHSSQADVPGGDNMVGFKNAELDALAVKLRETFETSERIAIAKRIQAIINQAQPYTFFQSRVGILLWANKGPPMPNRYLDGVTYGLDHQNPLKNRVPLYWHFRKE